MTALVSRICGFCTLLFVAAIIASCERRPLIDEEIPGNYAEVEITFDWTHLGSTPEGMSAIFYPVGGGNAIIHQTAQNSSTVRLPEGVYNVVAFNYTIGEFSTISFRGTDRYETIEAYANPLPPPAAAKWLTTRTEYQRIDHPEILAIDRLEGFEVTAAMVKQTQESLLRPSSGGTKRVAGNIQFRPLRMVAPGYASVHLKGVNYCRSACGFVSGLAGAIFLGSGRVHSPSYVMVLFQPPIYYPGSQTNGVLHGTFTSFGLLAPEAEELPHNGFLFSSVLVDKDRTLFERYFDVTEQIKQEVDVELNVIIKLLLELGINTDPDDDTPTIEVPEVVPESGGGFDVGVGGWDDEIEEDIIVR